MLRAGAVVFLLAGVVAIGIPKARFVAKDETPAQKEMLHQPSIVSAGTAMGFVRGVVGFMTFFVVFVLKFHKEPNTVFGFVVGASAIGNGLGALIAPVLRRRFREEWMLVGFITIPAIILVFAARVYGVPSLAMASAIVALSAAAAKLAFDSLLQRDAHDAVRGRAIARFETRFQLIWVGGGLLAVLLAPTPAFHAFDGKFGLFLMALVMLFVGFGYLGAVRHTATRDPKDPPDAASSTPPVSQSPRLAMLRRERARRSSSARVQSMSSSMRASQRPGASSSFSVGSIVSRSDTRLRPSIPARSITPSQKARPLS